VLAIQRRLKPGDRTMTLEFASLVIGAFVLVVVLIWVLTWTKLRVMDRRLTSMQNQLKDLYVMESRLFNMLVLNAHPEASLKKADTDLIPLVPAGPNVAPEHKTNGAAKQV
jgi:hypothetical protein